MKFGLLVSFLVLFGIKGTFASVKPKNTTLSFPTDSTKIGRNFLSSLSLDSMRVKHYPISQVTPFKQYYKMPIARMDVHSKMPVMKPDSSVTYKTPVIKLNPTPKNHNNPIYP
ncbi:hypothetical protein GS399_06575 [Pedobacter sp. HMF7647]|uniref:Uncharacterized protein n=1 Tax=Hufsiella arboris TaxID=2695275 RepID=A0A7K1Y7S4_9SPHI|nr:hypothetical protein [Hufsiella arboris]MXV50632.1 hypothetical protein [Hufsiella arboris]